MKFLFLLGLCVLPLAYAGETVQFWDKIEEDLNAQWKKMENEKKDGGWEWQKEDNDWDWKKDDKDWDWKKDNKDWDWQKDNKDWDWQKDNKDWDWQKDNKDWDWQKDNKDWDWQKDNKDWDWQKDNKDWDWQKDNKDWDWDWKNKDGKADKKDAAKDMQQKEDVYADFLNWMKTQKEHDGNQEAYLSYMKRQVMEYKNYMKAKHIKAAMAKKADEAAEKKEQLMKTKYMLAQKAQEVEHALYMAKFKTKVKLAKYVVGYCGCATKDKDVFDRLGDDTFGDPKEWADYYRNDMNSTFSERTNITSCVDGNCTTITLNNTSTNTSGMSGGMNWMSTPWEDARKLLETEPKERFPHVMKYLIKTICYGTNKFAQHLLEVEKKIVSYNMMD